MHSKGLIQLSIETRMTGNDGDGKLVEWLRMEGGLDLYLRV
ncbi:MAG: hypothetical protein ACJAZ2_001364 [Glaciecola sp.]|jgi:hypothetical protein